jgi:uncharacterized membrane protein
MKRLLLLGLFFLLGAAHPTRAQYTFTSLDFLGGTLTTARGINDRGEIVGAYRITPPRRALLIRGGNYIPLAPASFLATHFSEAFKTNDSGEVVGDFIGDDGFTHGFLLNSAGVTTLDFPGASDTIAFGINDLGTVVGYWDILDSAGNLLAYHSTAWGINSADQIVGNHYSDLNLPAHGFLAQPGNIAKGLPAFGAPTGQFPQPTTVIPSGEIVRRNFKTKDE